MHFVDDIDLGARRDGPVAGAVDNLAHIVNTCMRGGVHLNHIDMARFNDGLTMHAQLRHVDGWGIDLAGQLIIEGAGQNSRRCGFAHPAHAGQNIGLMNAVAVKGIGQCAHHRLLTDEVFKARRAIFAGQNAIRG